MNLCRCAIACLAILVGALSGSCDSGPHDCFGFKAARDFSVRLVDDASSPTNYADPGARLETVVSAGGSNLPSCGTFDGVAAGSVVDLTSATLISASGVNCSVVRADATLESGEQLESIRTNGRFDEHLFVGGAAIFKVVHRGEVAGCWGSWVLDFEIGTLFTKYGARTDQVWSKDKLFDPGEPGGQAPVLAARLFQMDEGETCSALPLGVTRCVDVYLARFEPTNP